MIEKVITLGTFAAMCLAGFFGLWAAGCETIRDAILPMMGLIIFGAIAIVGSNSIEYDDEY